MVYSTKTIVPIISPSPEIKPGISIFRMIAFRIIAFRYGRAFVALSCQSPDNNSEFGKTVPHRESTSTKYCFLARSQ